MTASQTTVFERLRSIQVELKAPKTESGRFGKHRNAEGILQAVKPLLEKHKLTLIQDNGVEEIGGKNYIKAVAAVTDREGKDRVTATAYAWEGEISRSLDAPQVSGAATSYARKYALSGLFAIDDSSNDPDGHKEPANNKPQPAAKPKPQQDTDPATPKQKQQLKNMMAALNMSPESMAEMVEGILDKKTVDTYKDYKDVLDMLEAIETDEGSDNG